MNKVLSIIFFNFYLLLNINFSNALPWKESFFYQATELSAKLTYKICKNTPSGLLGFMASAATFGALSNTRLGYATTKYFNPHLKEENVLITLGFSFGMAIAAEIFKKISVYIGDKLINPNQSIYAAIKKKKEPQLIEYNGVQILIPENILNHQHYIQEYLKYKDVKRDSQLTQFNFNEYVGYTFNNKIFNSLNFPENIPNVSFKDFKKKCKQLIKKLENELTQMKITELCDSIMVGSDSDELILQDNLHDIIQKYKIVLESEYIKNLFNENLIKADNFDDYAYKIRIITQYLNSENITIDEVAAIISNLAECSTGVRDGIDYAYNQISNNSLSNNMTNVVRLNKDQAKEKLNTWANKIFKNFILYSIGSPNGAIIKYLDAKYNFHEDLTHIRLHFLNHLAYKVGLWSNNTQWQYDPHSEYYYKDDIGDKKRVIPLDLSTMSTKKIIDIFSKSFTPKIVLDKFMEELNNIIEENNEHEEKLLKNKTLPINQSNQLYKLIVKLYPKVFEWDEYGLKPIGIADDNHVLEFLKKVGIMKKVSQ